MKLQCADHPLGVQVTCEWEEYDRAEIAAIKAGSVSMFLGVLNILCQSDAGVWIFPGFASRLIPEYTDAKRVIVLNSIARCVEATVKGEVAHSITETKEVV